MEDFMKIKAETIYKVVFWTIFAFTGISAVVLALSQGV